MNTKKIFSTLCLLAAVCLSSLYAQSVGETILDGHYLITSLNPNEVKLLKGYPSQNVYNTVEYLDKTYSITSIGGRVFEGIGSYESIQFDNLRTMDDHAFFRLNCKHVDLSASSSLTKITWNAFAEASSIVDVQLPNSVTTIDEQAFYGGFNLTTVNGGTITNIGNYAFSKCSKLTSIDLSHVQNIALNAFKQCSSLSNVTLPQCLTSIGKDAFRDCNLHSLTLYNTTSTIGVQTNMMASNGVVTMHIVDWSNNNVLANRLSEFPMAINYTYNDAPVTGNYTIPSTITTLGQGALYHAAGLTGITLPASLTQIDAYALAKCTDLTSITSNALTPPTVTNANAFAEVNKSIPVTIPDNIETYYSYRHTTGWKDFTNYQVSLSTIKGKTIMELNDVVGSHTEKSVQDLLASYVAKINAANSKSEIETIYTEAVPVLKLAIAKEDCIASVKAAAVGVVSDYLQELIDGYVARINAATTVQAAEAVRDEAIAAFQLMKDKQPMIDALESKKEGVQSEAILNKIQSYIDYISNPSTTLAQATTKYNEEMPILEYILDGYKEGEKVGKAAVYTVPTQPGMRLKVTKKDGKVYEFQVTDTESTEYYRATE